MSSSCLTTAAILDLFTEEIESQGGRVTETWDDGNLLFTRSILRHADQVQPQDRVEGGVALRATDEQVCVYPYVFREVCRNGAIMAESIGAEVIDRFDHHQPEDLGSTIRHVVASCCAGHVFESNVNRIRQSVHSPVDMAISMLSWLSRLPQNVRDTIMEDVIGRFIKEGDSSRYGLMNAVTSLARDTENPDLRWRLEEMGGGIGAAIEPKTPVDSSAADSPYRRPVCV